MGNSPSAEEKVAGKLKEKLSNVNISQNQVAKAELALRRATSSSWNSKLIHDKVVNLKYDNIDALAEIVIEELGMDDENEAKKKVKSAFRKMRLVDEDGGVIDSQVEELDLDVKHDKKFKCIYGFITAALEGMLQFPSGKTSS